MIDLGDSAPDVRVFSPDGVPHQLAETWQNGSHALLVFLRHLG
jgi:hypothetical protein